MAKLGSGSAAAIILGAATTSLLVASFSAASIGALALALSGAAICTEVLLLRLDIAVLKVEHIANRKHLCVRACMLILVVTAVLHVAISALLRMDLPLSADVQRQLPAVAPLAGMMALNRLLRGLHSSAGAFGVIAKSSTLLSSVTLLVAVGLTAKDPGTLPYLTPVACYLAGQAMALLYNTATVLRHGDGSSQDAGRESRAQATLKYHRGLCVSTFTSTLPSVAAASAAPWVLAAFYNAQAAGVFYLLNQLVLMPMALASGVVWSVVNAGMERRGADCDRRELLRAVNRGFAPVALLAAPVLTLLAPPLFTLLESGWTLALSVLPAFALMATVNFLSNTISYFTVFEMLRAEALWNTTILLGRLTALAIPGLILSEPKNLLVVYAIASSLLYASLMFSWGRRLDLLPAFMSTVIAAFAISGLCALVLLQQLPAYLLVLLVMALLGLTMTRAKPLHEATRFV